ncbi:MAG: SMI1/KNR4 family protein [Planctomycetes bacterium]|nr:SMI1/KNR4 family protein [Planctomycetota bacterium]
MAFPVDIQMVKRTGALVGRKLPLGYVAKMCKHNGGRVVTEIDAFHLHPIFDDSDKKRLKRTCNDIFRETQAARDWPDFPETVLAIGNNGAGELLVLLAESSSDRNGDAAYWWDHETGALNKAADDFAELKCED